MDIDRLEEFNLIARYESISRAAAAMGISPATLSARLKAFEKDLNCTLFEKDGKKLKLTGEGARFLADTKDLLTDYHDMLRQIRRSKGAFAYKRLRIAVVGSGVPVYLGPYLDRLNADYPNLHLQLLDDSMYSIEDGVLNDHVDLYFSPATSDFQIPGIRKLTIHSMTMQAVMPKNHRLADRSVISLHDLSGETVIPYPETAETLLRDYQFDCLRREGISCSYYEDFSSPVFYELLVPIGKGIVITPFFGFRLPPNSVMVPIRDMPTALYQSIFFRKENPSEEVERFIRGYREFAAQEQGREPHRGAGYEY